MQKKKTKQKQNTDTEDFASLGLKCPTYSIFVLTPMIRHRITIKRHTLKEEEKKNANNKPAPHFVHRLVIYLLRLQIIVSF